MAITEIKKNEIYRIQVIKGYKYVNGIKKPEKTSDMFYGKKSEAKARENEIKAKIKKGEYIDNTDKTYNDLIDKWYKERALNLDPKTVEGYDCLLVDIRKELGCYKTTELRTFLFDKFYNNLRNSDRHLSEYTLLHYYVLNNTILNQCVEWELIEKNYNKKAQRPKPLKREAKFYDEDDIIKLLKCLDNEPLKYQVVIRLALDSGCRRGELTGLTWNDIDFENSKITINKTTQCIKGKIVEKDKPKNNSSIRTIRIADVTTQLLKQYKQEQQELKKKLGNEWQNSNKILINNYGGLMHPDTPSKIFSKIQKKYNLKRLNFHGLRHTSASMYIDTKTQTDLIAKRLGHASSITTANIYSHLFKNAENEALDRVSAKYY